MKLLCSFLILAGVFALNDAGLSYEEQMRVVKDQMKLEDLRRMALNRNSNTMECSQKLLSDLGEILGIYNRDLLKCNETKEAEIQAHNAIALKNIDEFSNKTQNSCDSLSQCPSGDSIDTMIKCYETGSSQSASMLTGVSNDAATTRMEWQKNIENSKGKEDVCKTQAYSDYSQKSEKANSDFNDCVKNKKSEPSKTTPKAPTEAPSQTTPSENEEPGKRGDRPNRSGRYMKH